MFSKVNLLVKFTCFGLIAPAFVAIIYALRIDVPDFVFAPVLLIWPSWFVMWSAMGTSDVSFIISLFLLSGLLNCLFFSLIGFIYQKRQNKNLQMTITVTSYILLFLLIQFIGVYI